jgi:uncharacterized protein YbaR (Trm112 family)
MPVDSELLEILVCPETKQGLRVAPPDLIASLNARIDRGELVSRGGERVTKRIAEGLVREDGKVLYVVDDSIPVMLIEESVQL